MNNSEDSNHKPLPDKVDVYAIQKDGTLQRIGSAISYTIDHARALKALYPMPTPEDAFHARCTEQDHSFLKNFGISI